MYRDREDTQYAEGDQVGMSVPLSIGYQGAGLCYLYFYMLVVVAYLAKVYFRYTASKLAHKINVLFIVLNAPESLTIAFRN